ncbi:benzoate 4-monooxygenase [Periconia macrospinosa]|uniref:Benzoate 4-monooxygenase n=1 Tax=Periconia macrospinosa TaxID=97972 RepID=A0A2V1DG40_9PLEO|nr:benzoate 4-monooxygenase [Periconia macrospinosa]
MDRRFYLVSILLGVLSEVALFSRGEWDRHAPDIVKAIMVFATGVSILLWRICNMPFSIAIVKTSKHGTAALLGLFGSMIIYRVFFHRLRSFPGPVSAKISAWWIFKESIPDLKFYITLRGLHERYGDFVRIKPREISICHPDAILDIHGPSRNVRKGEFYDQSHPHQTLQFTRDPAFHRKKRVVWDKAFQNKSVQDYMPRLKKHYGILMQHFASHAASEEPVNVTRSFMFLGFDLISELIFGNSFNMLSAGRAKPIIGEFVKGKKMAGFTMTSIWHFHLIKALPGIEKRLTQWMRWFCRALDKREDMDLDDPDFYTHLSQSETWEYDRPHEAQLAIVAGSDTVSTTLTNVCYYLCQFPEYQDQLYAEISTLPDEKGLIDDQHLVQKPLLMGIINETLRLNPPVPSGVERLTPPEGAVIAGRYIPGNTVVTTPTYSLQREKRAFVNPDDFIPERWSTRPELMLRKEAFIPFSYGAYNCAGKSLALTELRMIL